MKCIDYSKYNKEELIALLEKSETEQAIVSSKLEDKRYLNLFRNITMGYIYGQPIYNQSGEVYDCVCTTINPAFEKIASVKAADCIGKHSRFTPFPIQGELLDKCSHVVKSKTEAHFDYYLATVNKWLEIVLYPSVTKNGFVMLFNDISERKQIENNLIKAREKAEEADRLKSSFLANVSHEIRTPLNSIVGFSALIAETEDREECRLYYDIVKTNSSLLLHLINDILDLSKIEAGKMVLNYQPVDLQTMCSELRQTHQLLANPGVKVLLEGGLECPYMLTDYNRLHQVFVNLLGNAIKNTESGVIILGYRRHENEVVFYVRDTGRGIPQDKLDSIFSRFVKVNESVQGFGLGLAISKSIVEKMGGRMEVDSRQGVGSEFRFVLPYTATEPIILESSLTKIPFSDTPPAGAILPSLSDKRPPVLGM